VAETEGGAGRTVRGSRLAGRWINRENSDELLRGIELVGKAGGIATFMEF
jgi:hypothetical protein